MQEKILTSAFRELNTASSTRVLSLLSRNNFRVVTSTFLFKDTVSNKFHVSEFKFADLFFVKESWILYHLFFLSLDICNFSCWQFYFTLIISTKANFFSLNQRLQDPIWLTWCESGDRLSLITSFLTYTFSHCQIYFVCFLLSQNFPQQPSKNAPWGQLVGSQLQSFKNKKA